MNVRESAGPKPGRQRKRQLVPSSIGVPQNRTLRIWAKKYFHIYTAANSEMAASISLISKAGGSWTHKTVINFFKAKDLEFNKLPGENVVQLHIKTVKVSRL